MVCKRENGDWIICPANDTKEEKTPNFFFFLLSLSTPALTSSAWFLYPFPMLSNKCLRSAHSDIGGVGVTCVTGACGDSFFLGPWESLIWTVTGFFGNIHGMIWECEARIWPTLQGKDTKPSAISGFAWASALKFLGSLHVICSLPSPFFIVAKLMILSDVVELPILVTGEFFPFFIVFGSTKIFLINSGMPSYSKRATMRSTTKATTRSVCMAFTSRGFYEPSGTKHQEGSWAL